MKSTLYTDAGNGHLKFRPVNLKYTRFASVTERKALTKSNNSKRVTLRTHRADSITGAR